MKFDPQKHHRRSIRLRGYDYSGSGYYFVTICVHGGHNLLGMVRDGRMELNEYGRITADSWLWLATRYPYVTLDEWVIMPNHMHGIIVIGNTGRGGSRTAPTTDDTSPSPNIPRTAPTAHDTSPSPNIPRTAPTTHDTSPSPDIPQIPLTTHHTPTTPAIIKPLGRLVGAFKTVSTKQINLVRGSLGEKFWQRNYYEHIIRNHRALIAIRNYIHENPVNWNKDQLYYCDVD